MHHVERSGSPGSPRPKKARASRKPSGNSAGAASTIPPVEPAPGGSSVFSTEVKIKAGRVKLTVDVNPIELRGDERDFFYLLIAKMEEYAAAHSSPPTNNGAAPSVEDEGGGS